MFHRFGRPIEVRHPSDNLAKMAQQDPKPLTGANDTDLRVYIFVCFMTGAHWSPEDVAELPGQKTSPSGDGNKK